MMELAASPADPSSGDDKNLQNLPYRTDLSYACAGGEGQNGNSGLESESGQAANVVREIQQALVDLELTGKIKVEVR
jgi:hypothetical protein